MTDPGPHLTRLRVPFQGGGERGWRAGGDGKCHAGGGEITEGLVGMSLAEVKALKYRDPGGAELALAKAADALKR